MVFSHQSKGQQSSYSNHFLHLLQSHLLTGATKAGNEGGWIQQNLYWGLSHPYSLRVAPVPSVMSCRKKKAALNTVSETRHPASACPSHGEAGLGSGVALRFHRFARLAQVFAGFLG